MSYNYAATMHITFHYYYFCYSFFSTFARFALHSILFASCNVNHVTQSGRKKRNSEKRRNEIRSEPESAWTEIRCSTGNKVEFNDSSYHFSMRRTTKGPFLRTYAVHSRQNSTKCRKTQQWQDDVECCHRFECKNVCKIFYWNIYTKESRNWENCKYSIENWNFENVFSFLFEWTLKSKNTFLM